MKIEAVAFEDARARALWDSQQAELFERYGEEDIGPVLPPDGVITSLLGTLDGVSVATALLRWSLYPDTGPGSVEVKRLFVIPEARGQGLSRVMMTEIERHARAAGATRIVLETGVKQPEAIGLYSSLGYSEIERFGEYAEEEDSVCMAKSLAPRED